MQQAKKDQLTARLKAATPSRVEGVSGEEYDTPGPVEIAEMLVEGEVEPEAVPDMLVDWLASSVDIPYVPDVLERKLFNLVLDALKGVVIDLIRKRV